MEKKTLTTRRDRRGVEDKISRLENWERTCEAEAH